MRKEYRIKKNKDFQVAFKKGKSVANRQLVICTLKKPDQNHFRIGLSVRKKIGNAVTRTHIKRSVRQACHELDGQLYNDIDFVIVARRPTATMDYFEIQKSLSHVLRLARVIKK